MSGFPLLWRPCLSFGVVLMLWSECECLSLCFSACFRAVTGLPHDPMIQCHLPGYVCWPVFWWCITSSSCHPPHTPTPLSLFARACVGGWVSVSLCMSVCAHASCMRLCVCVCVCVRVCVLACACGLQCSSHTHHVQCCPGGRHRRPASTCGTLLSWRRRGPRSPGAWTCPI
jgi:hypothetical protein